VLPEQDPHDQRRLHRDVKDGRRGKDHLTGAS
jgi:hypothetical protein